MSYYMPTKYSVVARRKGSRRAYGDGYIYPDQDSATSEAEHKFMTGQYSMVKVVNYETNQLIVKYPQVKE